MKHMFVYSICTPKRLICMPKWVLSLATQAFLLIFKPCNTGLMLLASACSTSITMGNVPLSLRISQTCQLEALAFLSIVIQFILLCALLRFINQAFFLAWQPLNFLTNECFQPDNNLTAFKGRVKKFMLLK